jgi:hypothetical protein
MQSFSEVIMLVHCISFAPKFHVKWIINDYENDENHGILIFEKSKLY